MAISNFAPWTRDVHRQWPWPKGRRCRGTSRLHPRTVPALSVEQRLGVLVGETQPALEREIPVFEIFDVAGYPVLNIGVVSGFAAKAPDLGQASNTRFDERPHMIVRQESRKLVVVLDQVRSRADNAHIAAEHVPKLRNLVEAETAKPFARGINTLVSVAGLP